MPAASVSNVWGTFGLVPVKDATTNANTLDSFLKASAELGDVATAIVNAVNSDIKSKTTGGSNAMALMMATVNDNTIFNAPTLALCGTHHPDGF